MPSNLSRKNIPEFIEKLDTYCKQAKIILCQPPVEVSSVTCKYEIILLSLVLFKYKEKLRFIFDDPIDIYNLKKTLVISPTFFNEFNRSRFNNDLKSIYEYSEFCKFAYFEAKKLFYIFYNHTDKEIKECYRGRLQKHFHNEYRKIFFKFAI